jgi:GntR family carbon starvation induced transcriptional regulator
MNLLQELPNDPQQVTELAPGKAMASQLEALIQRDIIDGALAPGSKLRLRELAERYSAGVTPLREALSRLCSTGFVVAIDQKGFRVSEVAKEQLEDILQTRIDIELLALTRAMRLRDPVWEGDLLAKHHQLRGLTMIEPGNPLKISTAWDQAHRAFHQALVEGCGSPWLIRFSEALRDQSARYRYLSVGAPEAGERDVAGEHAAIVDAVLSRDVELACDLLKQHYRRTRDLVVSSLSRLT